MRVTLPPVQQHELSEQPVAHHMKMGIGNPRHNLRDVHVPLTENPVQIAQEKN